MREGWVIIPGRSSCYQVRNCCRALLHPSCVSQALLQELWVVAVIESMKWSSQGMSLDIVLFSPSSSSHLILDIVSPSSVH